MLKSLCKNLVERKFASAGIQINGTEPWDIQVHDKRFYKHVMQFGSLGFGESYMEGWFTTFNLFEMMRCLLSSSMINETGYSPLTMWYDLRFWLFNLQNKKKAVEVGEQHYDLGNDLFQCMLDKRMIYSCAYWKDAKTLDEAQEAKLDLICRKLYLKPGQRVLDIGCGWGGFAKYGVEVVGITISKEQLEWAKQQCQGLPIELRFQDYRDVNEKFDCIASIAQFEAVGTKNFRTYMECASKCLKDDGLFLLHTIGHDKSTSGMDHWVEKYIFPNGVVPSSTNLTKALQDLFVTEDWHNFGYDYSKTLLSWNDNFQAHWPSLKDKYGERFHRMWTYYLVMCASFFSVRGAQLWQLVLSKNGVAGGYQSIR